MSDKPSAFPSGPQALLLILALFAIELVVDTLLHDAQGVLQLTDSQSWAIGSLIANGCVFATVMQSHGWTYRALFQPRGTAMRATAGSVVPWVLLLVPALVLQLTAVVDLVTHAFPLSDADRQLFERLGADDTATTLMGCVIAPVLEEMLFRGVILRGFLQRYERGHAIWASAALFGLAHLNIYQFAAALLLGAASGWLYARSRSLLPSIALHAGYNTALTLLANSQSDSDADAGGVPLGLWLACMALAAVGIAALVRQFDRDDAAARIDTEG